MSVSDRNHRLLGEKIDNHNLVNSCAGICAFVLVGFGNIVLVGFGNNNFLGN